MRYTLKQIFYWVKLKDKILYCKFFILLTFLLEFKLGERACYFIA